MKAQLITAIQQRMLPYLNNEQLGLLTNALEQCLKNVKVEEETTAFPEKHMDMVLKPSKLL